MFSPQLPDQDSFPYDLYDSTTSRKNKSVKFAEDKSFANENFLSPVLKNSFQNFLPSNQQKKQQSSSKNTNQSKNSELSNISANLESIHQQFQTKNNKFTLKDLCPEDKSKIGALIKKLALEQQDKQQLAKDLESNKNFYELQLKELQDQNEEISTESREIQEKLQYSLQLLKSYKELQEENDEKLKQQELIQRELKSKLEQKEFRENLDFESQTTNMFIKAPYNLNEHALTTYPKKSDASQNTFSELEQQNNLEDSRNSLQPNSEIFKLKLEMEQLTLSLQNLQFPLNNRNNEEDDQHSNNNRDKFQEQNTINYQGNRKTKILQEQFDEQASNGHESISNSDSESSTEYSKDIEIAKKWLDIRKNKLAQVQVKLLQQQPCTKSLEIPQKQFGHEKKQNVKLQEQKKTQKLESLQELQSPSKQEPFSQSAHQKKQEKLPSQLVDPIEERENKIIQINLDKLENFEHLSMNEIIKLRQFLDKKISNDKEINQAKDKQNLEDDSSESNHFNLSECNDNQINLSNMSVPQPYPNIPQNTKVLNNDQLLHQKIEEFMLIKSRLFPSQLNPSTIQNQEINNQIPNSFSSQQTQMQISQNYQEQMVTQFHPQPFQQSQSYQEKMVAQFHPQPLQINFQSFPKIEQNSQNFQNHGDEVEEQQYIQNLLSDRNNFYDESLCDMIDEIEQEEQLKNQFSHQILNKPRSDSILEFKNLANQSLELQTCSQINQSKIKNIEQQNAEDLIKKYSDLLEQLNCSQDQSYFRNSQQNDS